MNNDTSKNGPIHFYPTSERDAYVSNVVEYCVQVGEHQPITRTQATWLVVNKQVKIDGSTQNQLTFKIAQGAREIMIRGRNHHVVVHPAIKE